MAGSESLREGAWAGKAAYLVGGGPSLKNLDWSLLRDVPNVIVVNRAVIDCPTASIFFTEDVQFIVRFADALNSFKGLKVFHALDPLYEADALKAVPDLCIIQRKRQDKFWAKSFDEGLSVSSNSMIGALNIADLLGADPIFLLGVDCNRDASEYQNYHDDYPAQWRVGRHQLESFASDFKHWAAHHLKHRGVYNLNKDSGVDAWPISKAPYNDAVRKAISGEVLALHDSKGDLFVGRAEALPFAVINLLPPSPHAGDAGLPGVPAMEGE